MNYSYGYSRYSGRSTGKTVTAMIAAALALGLLTWWIVSQVTASPCTSRSCPAIVASRHADWVCGPAGCSYIDWLYFTNFMFTQVDPAQYQRYSPGSVYGTLGGLYANAGVTTFVQVTYQQQQTEDTNQAYASESYVAETEQDVTSEMVGDEPAGQVPDPDGVADEVAQEGYSPPAGDDDVDVDPDG